MACGQGVRHKDLHKEIAARPKIRPTKKIRRVYSQAETKTTISKAREAVEQGLELFRKKKYEVGLVFRHKISGKILVLVSLMNCLFKLQA